MLVRRQHAVLHSDQLVEGYDRIDTGSGTDQMNSASVTKAEVAVIVGHKLVLESGCSMPDNSGDLSGCGYVLADFALLDESSVGTLLLVTGNRGGVRDVHQLFGAFVGKHERLCSRGFGRMILGLGPRPDGQRGGRDRNDCCHDGHQCDYLGFHCLLLVSDCCLARRVF